MLTLSLLYVFCYSLTLLAIFFYLREYTTLRSVNKVHLKPMIALLANYHPHKQLCYILIAQLSGIAPSFLFFIKFKYLIGVLTYTHIFSVLVIFLNLLITTFFYLQVISKNTPRNLVRVYNTLFKIKKQNNLKQQARAFRTASFCYILCTLSAFSVFILPALGVILENCLR